jgi:hypothetical protein
VYLNGKNNGNTPKFDHLGQMDVFVYDMATMQHGNGDDMVELFT